MAKKTLTQLQAAAELIKNEVTTAANTALRVGSSDRDIIDSALFEFDPLAVYKPGQIVYYQSYLTQCNEQTIAGETPENTPGKWTSKIISDPSGIVLGNTNPVSGDALARFVVDSGFGDSTPIPASDTETAGKARRASVEEQLSGVIQDAYSTPEGVHLVVNNAIAQLDLVGSGSRFDLDLDYDVITHALIVSVTTVTQPELKITGTGSSTVDFVLAGIVSGTSNRYSYTFPGVLSSGRLYIRAAGDSMAVGTSVPVVIPELDYSSLLETTNF
ncbi:hypothetical protein [Spirosoma luteum]|uniref:hypothetical protein n=1 Tax=Spirosoma luteum TaxID=431553 RepID=UPI00035DDE29|nr:hypothetical protein [Spirosoma luteum]